MMRHIFLALLIFPHGLFEANKAPLESWKKQGVSFESYRDDAIECNKLGFYRDISNDESAKRFIRGFTTATDDLNKATFALDQREWSNTVLRTKPDEQKRILHNIQLKDVENCLIIRGYSKFTLTSQERRTLNKLPKGSLLRHKYLHGLASR